MDFSIDYKDLLSVGMAILCGGVIGFEREFKNKSTGFRTIVLICLGSTLFTIVSRYGSGSDDRISANIITGIGFIGAGVIFKDKLSVLGLTTAAVIWTTAAIGMVIGVGYHGMALIFTLITFIILSLATVIEKLIEKIQHNKIINVTFTEADCSLIRSLEDKIKTGHLKSRVMQIAKTDNALKVVLLISGNKEDFSRFQEMMIRMPEISEFY